MKNIELNILVLIVFSTLAGSVIFNFDISGGGASSDVATHWYLIQKLNTNLNNLFILEAGKDYRLLNFPLHHIIISRFDILSNSVENYLNFYFIFSLILPVIFFLTLKKIHSDINYKKLLAITLISCLLPNFQAAAVWGNSHITALVFFLLSLYFLNFNQLSNQKFKKKEIFFCLFFMTLASYTRQYYVIFFPYLLFKIYSVEKFKNFNLIFFILIFLAIPGLYHLFNNPLLLLGYKQEVTNFKSSIVIVLSIICFYFFPLFVCNLNNNIKNLKKTFSINELVKLIILALFLILICFNFKYQGNIGGGVFHKLSLLLFENYIILYLTSFMGLFLVNYYIRNKPENLLLMIPIIFSFSSGFFIFQKYFEPLIFYLFFTQFDKNQIQNILDKNKIIFLSIYYTIYWVIYALYALGIVV